MSNATSRAAVDKLNLAIEVTTGNGWGEGSNSEPDSREGKLVKLLKLTVVGLMVAALMALGGVALAQGSEDVPPGIGPNIITQPGPNAPPQVGPSFQERGETLPFTGGDVTLFVIVGAGAVALGAVALRAARGKSNA
jgi:hypothetical protein